MTGISAWINLAEAALWGTIGLLVLVATLMPRPRDGTGLAPRRWQLVLLALTLAAFAVSDLVETRTRAWWRPWWLLVWKGTCVLLLTAFVAKWWVSRRRGSERREP